ncbi:MAG: hypothetical protein KatS3mg076_2092 [Candidatus Binatia bacterium]|nr:MAG: hypothetical protein KatS3mg076_2092 [Candidatus Binatia bacterium]
MENLVLAVAYGLAPPVVPGIATGQLDWPGLGAFIATLLVSVLLAAALEGLREFCLARTSANRPLGRPAHQAA